MRELDALVIDGRADHANAKVAGLRHYGIHAYRAGSVQQAGLLLKDHTPDIIFSEYDLPGKSTAESVLNNLSMSERYVPMVVTTRDRSWNLEQRLDSLGVKDVNWATRPGAKMLAFQAFRYGLSPGVEPYFATEVTYEFTRNPIVNEELRAAMAGQEVIKKNDVSELWTKPPKDKPAALIFSQHTQPTNLIEAHAIRQLYPHAVKIVICEEKYLARKTPELAKRIYSITGMIPVSSRAELHETYYRESAKRRAQAALTLAHNHPNLIINAGLEGSGKTTVSHFLQAQWFARLVRTAKQRQPRSDETVGVDYVAWDDADADYAVAKIKDNAGIEQFQGLQFTDILDTFSRRQWPIVQVKSENRLRLMHAELQVPDMKNKPLTILIAKNEQEAAHAARMRDQGKSGSQPPVVPSASSFYSNYDIFTTVIRNPTTGDGPDAPVTERHYIAAASDLIRFVEDQIDMRALPTDEEEFKKLFPQGNISLDILGILPRNPERDMLKSMRTPRNE